MEQVRRVVRAVLGPNSGVYRAAAQATNAFMTWRSDGPGAWRTLERIRAGRVDTPAETVALRRLAHPIALRPGTEDVDTVLNNIVRTEWGRFDPGEPAWMIDAGAYIGDSAAYFLSRFPRLNVIALEPNRANHTLAAQNLAPYGERATLLCEGLYGSDETLRFGGAGIGASIDARGTEEIRCTSVPSLLARFGMPRIDVLKMDIEGAETSVFASQPETWLPRTEWILIETHGPQIEADVRAVLLGNGFSMRRHRSVWYCHRGGVDA